MTINEIVIAATFTVCLVGIYVGVWSMIQTRVGRRKFEMPEFNQKFYEEIHNRPIGEITADDLINLKNTLDQDYVNSISVCEWVKCPYLNECNIKIDCGK